MARYGTAVLAAALSLLAGPALAQGASGSTQAQSGSTQAQSGSTKPQSGSAQPQSGSAQGQTGSMGEHSGMSGSMGEHSGMMQHPGHMGSMGAAKGGGSMQLHQQMMKGSQEMRSMKMTGDVDRDFVTAMKRHHEHGIAMAKVALERAQDPKVKELAQRIIDSQQKELQDFDAWLSEHKAAKGGATGAAGGHAH